MQSEVVIYKVNKEEFPEQENKYIMCYVHSSNTEAAVEGAETVEDIACLAAWVLAGGIPPQSTRILWAISAHCPSHTLHRSTVRCDPLDNTERTEFDNWMNKYGYGRTDIEVLGKLRSKILYNPQVSP